MTIDEHEPGVPPRERIVPGAGWAVVDLFLGMALGAVLTGGTTWGVGLGALVGWLILKTRP
jgi:hypothetical protein